MPPSDPQGALPETLRVGLEDLVGDFRYARRHGDLGRLALLGYCEVRRWARSAGEPKLAEMAGDLMAGHPAADRESFLHQIDDVIEELDQVCHRAGVPAAPSAPIVAHT